MLRRLRLLVLLPVVLPVALLGGLVPAASADTWAHADRSGDVTGWRFDPEPPPCGTFEEATLAGATSSDITRLRVAHRRDDVRLTARFRDLRGRGQHSSTFFVQTPDRMWQLDVNRFESGEPTHTFFAKAPDYAALEAAAQEEAEEAGVDCTTVVVDMGTAPCRGLRAEIDPRADRVDVVLPRTCLRDPRWVRVGLSSSGETSGPDPWYVQDRWVPGGTADTSGIVGRLSPPVRRDRREAQKAAPSYLSRVTNSETSWRRSFVTGLTGFPIGTTAASAN